MKLTQVKTVLAAVALTSFSLFSCNEAEKPAEHSTDQPAAGAESTPVTTGGGVTTQPTDSTPPQTESTMTVTTKPTDASTGKK